MPKRNNIAYCINHPDVQMEPLEGFNALTKLLKSGDKFTFNPSSGVPIKAYMCRQCGYIELYHATTTEEWRNS
ncbi:hypothetical protein [Tenuifilum osseticum]|uniref:hypothetical protein n=1 Tax=Tenuifilum osseticum TaxID=3374723 RepID=UPI0034E39330